MPTQKGRTATHKGRQERSTTGPQDLEGALLRRTAGTEPRGRMLYHLWCKTGKEEEHAYNTRMYHTHAPAFT